LGMLAIFLIMLGLDWLYARLTGRDGVAPMLFNAWPWRWP
jgi:hypothetical protein